MRTTLALQPGTGRSTRIRAPDRYSSVVMWAPPCHAWGPAGRAASAWGGMGAWRLVAGCACAPRVQHWQAAVVDCPSARPAR
jgi:hypothetical protein